MSLTLNQKIGMTKLSVGGMTKAETGQKVVSCVEQLAKLGMQRKN